jgi:hypothetical protein
MIVRTVGNIERAGTENVVYTIELYKIPHQWGTMRIQASFKDRVFLENKLISHFCFNDAPVTCGDDHPTLKQEYPPPISIYGQTIKEVGLIHINISPEPCQGQENAAAKSKRPGDVKWEYTLNYAVVQSRHVKLDQKAFVLPGMFRTLIVCVESDDRTDHPKVLNLRRYINPDWKPDNYKFYRRNHNREQLLVEGRTVIPRMLYASLDLPPNLTQELAEEGLGAIAFDEGIGRICLVPGRHRKEISVVDMSYMTKPELPPPDDPSDEE